MRRYHKRLDELNVEINEQKEIIANWAGSKNKLKKQKKKLRNLELTWYAVKTLIRELEY